jgi:methylated-DNA-[protein]-cysteine S-methyltransferase
MHQLEEYFSGRRRSFDLALDIRGGEYQLRVWRALSEIPYGETRTYGGLARLLGNAQSARAVGLGCATNPLPIIIPCHRVLSSTGSLQGFGGGLWRKRALLHLEQGQEVLSLAE